MGDIIMQKIASELLESAAAENDKLKAEIERLRDAEAESKRLRDEMYGYREEVERVRAENERLRKLTTCDSCGRLFDENGGICEPCNSACVAGNIRLLKAENEQLRAALNSLAEDRHRLQLELLSSSKGRTR